MTSRQECCTSERSPPPPPRCRTTGWLLWPDICYRHIPPCSGWLWSTCSRCQTCATTLLAGVVGCVWGNHSGWDPHPVWGVEQQIHPSGGTHASNHLGADRCHPEGRCSCIDPDYRGSPRSAPCEESAPGVPPTSGQTPHTVPGSPGWQEDCSCMSFCVEPDTTSVGSRPTEHIRRAMIDLTNWWTWSDLKIMTFLSNVILTVFVFCVLIIIKSQSTDNKVVLFKVWLTKIWVKIRPEV